MTQVFTDFRKYERSIIWHEFWFGREEVSNKEEQIFKKQKTNMPKGHSTPEELKVFLSSIKSELSDPRNRNKVNCNLPEKEVIALKELIQLQKNRHIIIKPCDKGAGIMILDFKEYMKACYNHLLSKTKEGKPYYTKVEPWEVERTKNQIRNVLKDGLEKEIISREEYNAMSADDKNPGKFYSNFKVHKPHTHGEAPPVRPIVSGSGSLTEGIATYVEHFIKESSTYHDTYLQDTCDFLREIERINKGPKLNKGALLATLDVEALFTNIVHEDGLQQLQEKLHKRKNPKVPTDFLMKLMEIILKHNIFAFNDSLWRQEVGAAMGSKPVPSYADIFLASIDKEIKSIANRYNTGENEALLLLKRFLDDIFSIFNVTTKKLHELLEDINQINPSIKLTLTHTSVPGEAEKDKCDCKPKSAIPFLDTMCSIKNGRIYTDLYRKPTDRNQYLLPDSCHPKTTTKAIPKSLALRIVRICADPDIKNKRLEEMKVHLLNRGYQEKLVDSALNKARAIPRKAALKRRLRPDQENRPVFATTFDPRLPSITSLQAKHWRTMTLKNKYLADVFPNPPLTGYRRQQNIRNHIIRAAISKPPGRYPERIHKGMHKCNQVDCTACPYINEGKHITINNTHWRIEKKVNCNTYNVVYAIICKKDKCGKVYIGETKRLLKFRLADHRGYVVNKDTTTATGQHFNLPGHNLADLSITVVEQVRKNDLIYRKEREELHIRRFDTFNKGLNRKT